MVRLFLLLLLVGMSNYIGFAHERLNICGNSGVYSPFDLTAKFDFFNSAIVGEGIQGSSRPVSEIVPDIKKNLSTESMDIDAIKIKILRLSDAEVHFLIRKDNLFLLILRI